MMLLFFTLFPPTACRPPGTRESVHDAQVWSDSGPGQAGGAAEQPSTGGEEGETGPAGEGEPEGDQGHGEEGGAQAT